MLERKTAPRGTESPHFYRLHHTEYISLMPTSSPSSSSAADAKLPPTHSRWKSIGPGVVAAATGVGAGDLVATLAAGSRLGYTLLWAVLLGVVVKIALAEAVGRYHLATGSTLLRGWRRLGVWTSWYFGVYIVVWGFTYGATIMTATGMPLNAMFPVLSIGQWGALCALAGLLLVGLGDYAGFERIMTFLVGLMFVSVVGVALLLLPDVPQMLTGLWPRLPAGSLIYTLGLLGGVGGTITMAAYGYWFNAKGWRDASWMPIMRLDNGVSYVITGIFVVSMMIVGAELLYVAGTNISKGDKGLIDLSKVLYQRFGPVIGATFLVGFWATSMTSLLGVWNGVSLIFSDFVRHARQQPEVSGAESTRTPEFRAYLLWLTFPPMLLIFFVSHNPVQLVLLYGVLGAFFMPFLAGTLLWLLNAHVGSEHRNGWFSNLMLIVSLLLFGVLCIADLLKLNA
jgi:Mn2+/Fe2+ NRAMP family transporter